VWWWWWDSANRFFQSSNCIGGCGSGEHTLDTLLDMFQCGVCGWLLCSHYCMDKLLPSLPVLGASWPYLHLLWPRDTWYCHHQTGAQCSCPQVLSHSPSLHNCYVHMHTVPLQIDTSLPWCLPACLWIMPPDLTRH
jgi:hypothetical protein